MFGYFGNRLALGLTMIVVGTVLRYNRGDAESATGKDNRPDDRILQVRTNDAEVNAAKDKGRSTYRTFLDRLQNPAADESAFSVKFDLTHQNGSGDNAELIWASDLKVENGRLSGRLADTPSTAGYEFGQRVDIATTDIVDWAIKKNGAYEGHFTTRAMLPYMRPEEAATVKQYLGWS